jgi:hypothetical protein
VSTPKTAVRVAFALLCAAFVALVITACGGGSSGQATDLLKQTFSGSHTVNSGNLSLDLTLNPSGSSTIKGPITVTFGGPFASLGNGKLPKSDFNVAISALGHTGSLGILSTGTAGYVKLSGTSYQLPATTFRQLESSFSSLTSSSSGGAGSGALGKLGINPMHWLKSPTIAGNDTVAGANTTHIRSGVNVPALLSDLNTFLGKASSLGVSGASKLPTSISPSTRARIASAVRQPSLDVWTGASDRTLRKLSINMTVPVTGQISSLLGGLSSAQISLSMQYANLNQPQTIAAPTKVAPYKQFQAKIQSFLSSVQGAVGGAPSGTGSTGGSTSSPGGATSSPGGATSSPGASNLNYYTKCLQTAGSDITKMQQCAALLNGK